MNERDIFIAALEKATAQERSEYISAACGGDSTLQQRVEGLLQMHEKTGEFLQKPLVERLVEGVAALEDAADTARDPSASPKRSVGLDFLSPSAQPGSLGRLGHYEVQEVIGSGGMGIVLRAFDERLHRVVAIKVMAAPLAANAAARKRFQREARAAAAVCHDNIVTIHAVEESDEVPYLVMQCISGLSLQQRIDRDGPLELHEILRIAMQTAAGLAAAHAQGLIHRDIKPANILLENGVERVKITDFGLARAAADASISQSGAVIGTPQYMAPEQARGEALDGRTDLFGLGSVLYAMCTGRAPFRAASSIAVLKRVCEEAPSPIREANADIPDWLVVLIDKLHAKNPDDRYQSAAEVAEVLGQRLAQLQNSTALPPAVLLASGGRKPPDSSVPAGGFLARKRRWALAAAAVLVLAATLGLAEGTGATKFTATVIRLLTPEGTLVVEMTDPEVKVTIDGDGGLVITGVGQHEVRLKLGSHTLQADKDGKPVPLDQELVTITRDDKPVVRVRLEGAAAPPVAAPKAKPEAFVLLDGQGVEVRKLGTLADAVQSASDGDTIEIRGNGPFVSKPISIGRAALTIRAGAGFRPVIKPSSEGIEQAPFLTTDAALVLEGLDFQVMFPEDQKSSGRSIQSNNAPLRATNCRFHGGIWMTQSPVCEFRNCEFLNGGWWGCCAQQISSGARVLFENCLFWSGGHAIHLFYAIDATDDVSIQITRSTFTSKSAPLALSLQCPMPAGMDGPKASKPIRLEVSRSIFDSTGILAFGQQQGFTDKAGVLPPAEADAMLLRLLEWRGEGNLFPAGSNSVHWYASFKAQPPRGPKGLDEWKKFSGSKEVDSRDGRPRFHGGSLLARANLDQLTPEDFRLRPDSAGYRAGKDGKDLGADVDLVGPGPAYERWKKTPEYQQWLKETKQVVKTEAPKAELKAFVLLGGKGVAERKFDTLAEAVQTASDGDTIEVHGNGPFVTQPIFIGKIGLTIRAALAYRPVLQFVRTEAVPLQSDGPLVLEGLEIQSEISDPKQTAALVRPGPSFFAANCLFRLNGGQACVWDQEVAKQCVLYNCEVHHSQWGSVISGAHSTGFKGQLDNCLLTACVFDTHTSSDMRVTSLQIMRTTVVGDLVARLHFGQLPKDNLEKPKPWFHLSASSSIIDVGHVLSTYQDKATLADGKSLPAEKLENFLERMMAWHGERNVYSSGSGGDGQQMFLIASGASDVEQDWLHGPMDLAAWSKFWGSPDPGAIKGKVRYQGGDLLAKLATAPEKLTADDFRLRPDSAGYRAGKDGKDLGANVDLVGPGPAYERWKKTPEYQQWLKDTKQVE